MNSSKLNSPSSNNSQTESETSETASVEENTQKTSASQNVTKNWKKLQESERPPWKGTSVSTLPKANKEALLKAKLLDATRRMRDKKTSTLVQTDEVAIKITRDGDTMVGNDLIIMEDKANITDGSIMLTENTGEFILKQTVGLMTEGILVNDAETQTNLPLPDCVYSFLKDNPMRFNKYYYNLDAISQQEAESEKHLQRIRETRKEIRQFNQKARKKRDKSKNLSDDSLSSDDDNYLRPKQKMKNKIPDTMKQWYFPEETSTQFQPYSYITNRPSGTMPKDTSSLRNMQYYPHSLRSSSTCNCQCQCGKSPTTNISPKMKERFVNESSSLLNELESLRICKSKWKNDPGFPFAYGKEIDRLSEKYNPMLSKNTEILEALEKKIKNPPIPKKHFDYIKIEKDESLD